MNRPMSEAVVIGASAGALDALSEILPELPRGFPLPIFIVVHLPADKESLMAPLLQSRCQLSVVEAEDKLPIERGAVYLAPPDYHLLIESKQSIALSNEEPVLFSRPSVDVLFTSAAEVYAERLVGVVLTGANSDGAAGVQRIAEVGGVVLVQHPHSAHASAMPQAAIDACPQASVMSLKEIARCLCEVAAR